MKMFLKILLIIFIGFVAILLVYSLYMWATYIDDTVSKGDAYGFRIGDSKEETYRKAHNIFNGKKVFMLSPLDERGLGPIKEFDFKIDNYSMIGSRNYWRILLDESLFNGIDLTFKNNKLVRIYRHRQKFELP